MAGTGAPVEHLSIGELLATLRDEFPDITISKIRFLESQGLIDPERTPSGYRKFYGDDIARLRWILHQQKEHFLPLKVIKGRLEEAGPGTLPDEPGPASPPVAPTAAPARSRSRKTPGRARAAGPKPAAGSGARSTAPRRSPKQKVDSPPLPLDDGPDDDLDAAASGASLTRVELAAAAGLDDAQLAELEGFGLLEPVAGSGERVLFDEDALEVANLAAAFARYGIGPRHLRMYRTFAEREATLFGQVVQPVMRQRNPEARARARDELVELARLGRVLRTALLRSAVSDLLTD